MAKGIKKQVSPLQYNMDKLLLESYLNDGLSLNQIAKKSGKCLTTIRYWASKHKLKSNFEVFHKKEYGEFRFCPRCKTNVPTDKFYSKRGVPNASSYCGSCTNEQTKERQRKFKKQCVEYKGGKCKMCGYSKCIAALDFHHLDPSKKEFNISHRGVLKLTEEFKAELDKCDLVCVRCHREIHSKSE